MTPLKIYGLVGYPIGHSLSPAMHNAAFARLQINAEYKLFPLKEQELSAFMRSLSQRNIYGLNVTMPYKSKIMESIELDGESFYLREIKAVNTIARRDDRLIGFNTDIPGFAKHLKKQFDPSNGKAAILGAGGASKASAYALAAYCGVKEIAVFDIDQAKTNEVISIIKRLFADFKIYGAGSIKQLNLEDKNLLVNATPIGMKETDNCLIDESLIHKDLFVYDLIYNPKETKLLKIAKQKGAGVSNGLGMLLYQGALAFEIWTGKKAPIDTMREALSC